jgi:hypothetical protein
VWRNKKKQRICHAAHACLVSEFTIFPKMTCLALATANQSLKYDVHCAADQEGGLERVLLVGYVCISYLEKLVSCSILACMRQVVPCALWD